MNNYKFQRLHDDSFIRKMQQEIQDNLASVTDVNGKADKVTSWQDYAPQEKDMADGEEIVAKISGSWYLYKRVGAYLIRFGGMEVDEDGVLSLAAASPQIVVEYSGSAYTIDVSREYFIAMSVALGMP